MLQHHIEHVKLERISQVLHSLAIAVITGMLALFVSQNFISHNIISLAI